MNFLRKAWEFLNGKKTWVGAALWIAGYVGECSGTVPADIAGPMKDIGAAMGGLGVVHKVYKAGERKGAA